MNQPDIALVDELVQRHGQSPASLIPILQGLQDRFHHLPPSSLDRISQITDITPAAIEGVATFYHQFRLKPAGRHLIRICHGTACHVRGSLQIEQAIRRHLHIPDDHDTDPANQFTLEPVACVGCCSIAPVIQIDHTTCGQLTFTSAASAITSFIASAATPQPPPIDQEIATRRATSPKHQAASVHASGGGGGGGVIHVSLDACCQTVGSDHVFRSLMHRVDAMGLNVTVHRVGCRGLCRHGPTVAVATSGSAEPAVVYAGVEGTGADELLWRHFKPRSFVMRAGRVVNKLLDHLLGASAGASLESRHLHHVEPDHDRCESMQVRIASEHHGQLDPLSLDEYLLHDGFAGLKKSLDMPAGAIIDALEHSGLRGRGGAGFPTGTKWRKVSQATSPAGRRFVICNGDEGDPGAFMDRTLLESFPLRIIEGMMIAARAVGAGEGIFYIRHEYPLAVSRVKAAIDMCEAAGLLGDDVMGCGWGFKVRVVEGAGAFVCGEETALIASIEGGRGTPRLRPPYPAESGLWGCPTLVNNVETLASVPWIMRHGSASYAAIGSGKSRGTKVFALAGKVQRGGLIEVPLGMTLRQIVDDLGGGVAAGRRFKAVQIGGPSGGCIPASLADTPVDYESLRAIGAVMGSGGLVVLDDTDCMVDIARYFLQFTQAESCGKCTFCRIGTRRMLQILTSLCEGKAQRRDLDELRTLCGQVVAGSICGLGRTAPNPVLTTLEHFAHEYEAHLAGCCPAGRCRSLIHYTIDDRCVGCTICAQHCPTSAIALTPHRLHVIDDARCIRCDVCRTVCPELAVSITTKGGAPCPA
jgi:NADH-quinone oxidoreductase subunit F